MIILAEGRFGPVSSKTANGAIAFMTDRVVAVIDSRMAGKTAQEVLGYGGSIPVVGTLQEGMAFRPDALLIGIAPAGGQLPAAWRRFVLEALRGGLHILSGLHTMLADDPEFAALAASGGLTITDLRRIPQESKVVSRGTWRLRRARTVLTVGTDCKIGKMTTLLAVDAELRRRGRRSAFIGTGQTGILIAGNGVSVDAVVGDYIAGSIEREIDRADRAGAELILVEGQGALTHQGYSSVTLGLMHGTMPDAMILNHQPTRLSDDYGFPLPGLRRTVRLHEEVVGIFRPTKVVGIGLNSVGLTDAESRDAARRIEDETGLPAIDAFRFGAGPLVDALESYLASAPRVSYTGPLPSPSGPWDRGVHAGKESA
jgi:uncharacterized NAD-dependent epimerase/dehydratase family protein